MTGRHLDSESVIVVGGGFGGLSAACHPADAGADVTVLERRETLAEHLAAAQGKLLDELLADRYGASLPVGGDAPLVRSCVTVYRRSSGRGQ